MKPSSVAGAVLLSLALAVTGHTVAVDDLVVQRLYEHYSLDTLHYAVEVLSNPLREMDVDPEQVALRPLTRKEPLGLFTVLVEVTDGGALIKRGQVRLRVRKYADVLVAAGRLARHESLTADRLVKKRMEVTSLREQPVTSVDRINGCRLARNLSKGQILTAGAIQPVPDIDVGREVSIVIASGLCTITAPGRSLQAGLTGSYIRVKNMASGKILNARVVDSLSVAVDP
jgi:flagella basal body P-ring formation protein FlgA